jgi:hypothetical protein
MHFVHDGKKQITYMYMWIELTVAFYMYLSNGFPPKTSIIWSFLDVSNVFTALRLLLWQRPNSCL